jgi:hypothetical protein
VALACRRRGIGTLLVPCANGSEAAAVTGLRVVPAGTLGEAVERYASCTPSFVHPLFANSAASSSAIRSSTE